MLYLNYWCISEEEKQELKNKLNENEKTYQVDLNEKYSYDNIFKEPEKIAKTEEESAKEINSDNTQMIEYKESFIKKIFAKIKSFFRR